MLELSPFKLPGPKLKRQAYSRVTRHPDFDSECPSLAPLSRRPAWGNSVLAGGR